LTISASRGSKGSCAPPLGSMERKETFKTRFGQSMGRKKGGNKGGRVDVRTTTPGGSFGGQAAQWPVIRLKGKEKVQLDAGDTQKIHKGTYKKDRGRKKKRHARASGQNEEKSMRRGQIKSGESRPLDAENRRKFKN